MNTKQVTPIETLRAFNNLVGLSPFAVVNAIFPKDMNDSIKKHLQSKLNSKCKKYDKAEKVTIAALYDWCCELDSENTAAVNEFILLSWFCQNQKEVNAGITVITVMHNAAGVKEGLAALNGVCTAIAEKSSVAKSLYEYAATTIGRVYNAYPFSEM